MLDILLVLDFGSGFTSVTRFDKHTFKFCLYNDVMYTKLV